MVALRWKASFKTAVCVASSVNLGFKMSFRDAPWRLKQVPSKVADQLWMREDLSSHTNNRYPAQLYDISQDENREFNHLLWNMIRNAEHVRINKHQRVRLLWGTWAREHEMQKVYKNCFTGTYWVFALVKTNSGLKKTISKSVVFLWTTSHKWFFSACRKLFCDDFST